MTIPDDTKAPATASPDYVLVPVEPTEAMISVAATVDWEERHSNTRVRLAVGYRAMLAARPVSPAGQKASREQVDRGLEYAGYLTSSAENQRWMEGLLNAALALPAAPALATGWTVEQEREAWAKSVREMIELQERAKTRHPEDTYGPDYSINVLESIEATILARRTPSPSGAAGSPSVNNAVNAAARLADNYQPSGVIIEPAVGGDRTEPPASGSGTEADSRAAFAKHMRELAKDIEQPLSYSAMRFVISAALDRFEANGRGSK